MGVDHDRAAARFSAETDLDRALSCAIENANGATEIEDSGAGSFLDRFTPLAVKDAPPRD